LLKLQLQMMQVKQSQPSISFTLGVDVGATGRPSLPLPANLRVLALSLFPVIGKRQAQLLYKKARVLTLCALASCIRLEAA
jgi:hypothetical protein